jgi:YihY family inner membrane protein
MNPAERAARAVDHLQQRHRPVAFVVGVVKKFGDDRGSMLVALLTYYGFMSLFPLLLVATTILGFIGNPALVNNVIGETLRQFPVYGDQLGRDAAHPLHGNSWALALGLLGLIYGSLGIAQAGQHAMAEVWNVPGVRRPGFFPRLVRALVLFATVGLGMAAGAGASVLVLRAGNANVVRGLLLIAQLLLNVGLAIGVFRILTPKDIPTGDLIRGAILAAVGYTALLNLGTALVQHQLRHARAVYGQFGFVLGLIGWIYLVAELTMYSAEINVVRVRRLWPRSIVQPPLTDADRRVLHDIARQEERRPEQRVGVGFDPDAVGEATDDAEHPRR